MNVSWVKVLCTTHHSNPTNTFHSLFYYFHLYSVLLVWRLSVPFFTTSLSLKGRQIKICFVQQLHRTEKILRFYFSIIFECSLCLSVPLSASPRTQKITALFSCPQDRKGSRLPAVTKSWNPHRRLGATSNCERVHRRHCRIFLKQMNERKTKWNKDE